MARDEKTLADKLSEDDDNEQLKSQRQAKASPPRGPFESLVDVFKGTPDSDIKVRDLSEHDGDSVAAKLTTPPRAKATGTKWDAAAQDVSTPVPSPDPKDLTGPPVPAVTDKGTPGTLADDPRDPSVMRARQGIKAMENAKEDPGLHNSLKGSTAEGLYQFEGSQWDSWMKKNYGKSVSEVVDSRTLTPAQKTDEQEKMFDVYYQKQAKPWIDKVKANGLSGQYNDTQLLALFHREGQNDAEKFLKTGESKNDNTPGNGSVADYMAKVAKVSGTDQAPGRTLPTTSTVTSQSPSGSPAKATTGEDYLARANPVEAQDAVSMKLAIASGDKNKFDTERQQLIDDYKAEKDLNAKRELADTLAEAITKFGAGRMGSRTGVDMSHIKFEPHDFQKDRDLAKQDFQIGLTDLKGRREEDQKKREAAADMSYKLNDAQVKTAGFNYTVDHGTNQQRIEEQRNKAMELQNQLSLQERADNQELNRMDRGEARDQKERELKDKRKQTALDSAAHILVNKEVGKDSDRASAAMIVLKNAGLDQSALHDAFYEKGGIFHPFGGESVRDVDEISKRLMSIPDADSAPHPAFTATKSDGTVLQFPTAKAAQQAQAIIDSNKKKG